MAFGVRVVEENGTVVEKIVADHNFNPVLRGVDGGKYPTMASLDPYRDTYLNHLQCKSLAGELRDGAQFLDEMEVRQDATLELIRLCEVVQAKPHRRLLFIGD
ncbi:hypothetical protein ACFT8P_32070 [Streptomyces sp. NPDC057101]|uniref:hypothetical protein n=1 Tax=Streptomyces sp. NPDC057101 TaxID=3346020 RepID=UPI0036290C48